MLDRNLGFGVSARCATRMLGGLIAALATTLALAAPPPDTAPLPNATATTTATTRRRPMPRRRLQLPDSGSAASARRASAHESVDRRATAAQPLSAEAARRRCVERTLRQVHRSARQRSRVLPRVRHPGAREVSLCARRRAEARRSRSRVRHLQPLSGAPRRTSRIPDHRTGSGSADDELQHQRDDRGGAQARAVGGDHRRTRRPVAQAPESRRARHEAERQADRRNPGRADEALQKSPEAGDADEQRRRVPGVRERIREHLRSAHAVFLAAYVRELQHQHVVVARRHRRGVAHRRRLHRSGASRSGGSGRQSRRAETVRPHHRRGPG